MTDLAPLCFLGLFLLLVFWMMSRMMRANPGYPYGRRGGESPRYDDPNIGSRGAFGDDMPSESPRYDSPDIESRGSFGRNRGFFPSSTRKSGPPGGLFGGRSRGLGGRPNSPNIRSRGGFGRDKD